MGDFDLRTPALGDSLRRTREPHVVDPEELRLPPPAVAPPTYVPPGRGRVDPADLLRAVGHYADEAPAPGPRRTRMPEAATPPAREPVVRLGSDVRTGEGDARTGVVTADAGGEALRVHAEGGLAARRDDSGTASVSGQVSGSIEAERADRALRVAGGATGLGTGAAAGSVEARARVGREDGTHVELDGSGEGLGTTAPRGSAGVSGRVGRTRGPHVDAAVRATELGSEHPGVMATTGIATGERLPRIDLEAGRTGGEDSTVRAGGSVSIAPRPGTSVRVGGAATGLETARPTGELSAEVRARLLRGLDLTASGGVTGLGSDATAGRAALGIDAEVARGLHLGVSGSATGIGTPGVAGEGAATLRLDLP